MKKILLLTLLSFSCAPNPATFVPTNGEPGKDGQNCTVEKVDNGALITCPGQEPVLIENGQDGKDGQDAPPLQCKKLKHNKYLCEELP
jgi:hypothetical protein